MRSFYLTLLLFFPCAHALDTEVRVWTSTAGTTLEAKLIATKQGYARLERTDGSLLTIQLDQLSFEDQDYVDVVTEVRGATEIEGIAAQPGKLSERINCITDPKWNYYLYLPKDFHDAREWPVWFIMSPGGGGNSGTLNRYIKGAEQLGCILALSVESKNGFDGAAEATQAMVDDIYNRLPVARNLGFASGMSGGSREAYYLAEQEENIAGILACGSGSGVYPPAGKFRSANLRSSTYVYSLIGANGFNRTGAFKSHDSFPDHYRLRFFPGSHTWAGEKLIAEGMA